MANLQTPAPPLRRYVVHVTLTGGSNGDRLLRLATGVGGLFVDAAPMPGEVEFEEFGAALDELAAAELLAGCNNVILRLLLLEHEALHFDVVAGVTPVAFGIEVTEERVCCRPTLMRARARVVLLLTKVSPRWRLSWFKRMPLLA